MTRDRPVLRRSGSSRACRAFCRLAAARLRRAESRPIACLPSPRPPRRPSLRAAPARAANSRTRAACGSRARWLAPRRDAEEARASSSIPAQLADPMAYPLGAVVSLGGCSASFVSPDGLVVTNHHCVPGALQYNSTPEQNLLEDGFLAKTRADEKSIGPTRPRLRHAGVHDVTRDVPQGLEAIADDQERHNEIEKRDEGADRRLREGPPERALRGRARTSAAAQYLLIERLRSRTCAWSTRRTRVSATSAARSTTGAGRATPATSRSIARTSARTASPPTSRADNVPFKPRQHLKLATQAARAKATWCSSPAIPAAPTACRPYDEVSRGRRLVVPAPHRAVRGVPRR